MGKRWALLAATMLVVALTGAGTARAVGPASGFGPSPTGCPAFWEVDGRPEGGDIDPPVGPFGTSQVHVTGLGFSVEGDEFTAIIRVANMQPRVVPGFTRSNWAVTFGDRFFLAHYDLLTSSFRFSAGRFSPTRVWPTAGEVVPGPGGGVRITAKMADLELGPHDVANTTVVIGSVGVVVETGGGTVSGPGPSWSRGLGPEEVPLVPCPGLSLSVSRDPAVQGRVFASGMTLPKTAGQAVELQLLSEGQWTTIATGTTDDVGYGMTATLPPGPATVRATVMTSAGVGTSAPVDV